MFDQVKKSAVIRWSIILCIIMLLYFYYILRPAIIFHSPNDYEYLGKVVCTYSGQQDKLYIKDFTAIYRMPYTFNWNESDEVAIFMKNYGNVLKKEDIDFWRLDIFLDEQGRYKSHSTRKFLGLYPW
ncbi:MULTISPECIES: hypothetical protein [Bacteroidales]|uniref:hypothetical protein n=1 Tax=Bacteroidales TaxID=171549 RepID=UPI001F16C016|nr:MULTISPECIES: hypothetical protein [Bacteroidales]MCE8841144.1 hypothetical protein [Bacteroides thetaiotaomicron]MCE8861281.1 hypothetical protein [Phocaeicola vulgatus]MCE9042196.1 hypothetical protein [Parabacteroides distasonis]